MVPEHASSIQKKAAHGVKFINGQPTVIYDTVCTKLRSEWLATEKVHQTLTSIWQDADFWLVGRYVMMPDHIHYFAWATEKSIKYENWVTYWKSQFSNKHLVPQHRWQPDHWDRRMRSAAAYEEKWNYVKQNPKRAGLVDDENDWPYQGEVYQLSWE